MRHSPTFTPSERSDIVDRFDLACDLIHDHWPGHSLRLVSPRNGVVFVEIPLRALEEIVAVATATGDVQPTIDEEKRLRGYVRYEHTENGWVTTFHDPEPDDR